MSEAFSLLIVALAGIAVVYATVGGCNSIAMNTLRKAPNSRMALECARMAGGSVDLHQCW